MGRKIVLRIIQNYPKILSCKIPKESMFISGEDKKQAVLEAAGGRRRKKKMTSIVWVVIMVLLALFVPKGLAVLIVLVNIFIPDMVPFIDEVLQVIVLIKKLSSD